MRDTLVWGSLGGDCCRGRASVYADELGGHGKGVGRLLGAWGPVVVGVDRIGLVAVCAAAGIDELGCVGRRPRMEARRAESGVGRSGERPCGHRTERVGGRRRRSGGKSGGRGTGKEWRRRQRGRRRRRRRVRESAKTEEDIVATAISERRVMPSPWLVHSAIIIPTSRSNLPLPVFTFHLIASITPVVPSLYLIHPGLLFIPRRPQTSALSPRFTSPLPLIQLPSHLCALSDMLYLAAHHQLTICRAPLRILCIGLPPNTTETRTWLASECSGDWARKRRSYDSA